MEEEQYGSDTSSTRGGRMEKPTPVRADERIQALDVLRGVALLGILLMNIQSFSMIEASYFNPKASGYFDGLDRWIWIAVHVLADSKFMTLFSILFGAGIVLMTTRAERAGARPVFLHYRRTFWLLLIGAAHAYLLWFGDVLVWYSLCALVVVWFRKMRPSWLLILGLVAIAVGSLLAILIGLSLPQMPDDARAGFMEGWAPSEEQIQKEVSIYQGSWPEQMTRRVPMSLVMHTIVFFFFASWRAGGLMLVGMALFKWGMLSAEMSRTFYRWLVLVGLVGMAIVSYGIYTNFVAGWTLDYSRFLGLQYNYWASLLVSAGYLGLVMLWCRRQVLERLKTSLAAVGRMAFTNYLMHTIVCTTIFYGHGLGLYSEANRSLQMLVVLGIWVFQLAYSPVWLRHFRFGPFEWLWRSLTYMKLQPFRIATPRSEPG
jgi:uncharacterized protein